MGQPRKSRKKYNTPPHPWNAERIKTENKLMSKYGLKNKKEIWKADTLVRKYSREARYLLGFSADQMQKEKLQLLKRKEIVSKPLSLHILFIFVKDSHHKSWLPLPIIFLPGKELINLKSSSVSLSFSAQEISPGMITVSSSLITAHQFLRIFSI